MTTLTYSTTLSVLDCGTCGIPFAIPSDLHRRVRESGDWFWCPNGHRIHYYEPENQKLRDRLEREERRAASRLAALDRERAAHAHTERRLRSTKAVVTKTKKRIAAGACPCCSQRFPDLATHMAEVHPGYRTIESGRQDQP